MTNRLTKHGTEAGYKAELVTGNLCSRCRAAHRVYNRQFSKAAKAKGLKYSSHDVLDHLDYPNAGRQNSGQSRAMPGNSPSGPSKTQPEDDLGDYTVTGGPAPDSHAQSPAGPSLGDRLGQALKGAFGGDGSEYVANDEGPDYITPGEPDPEPGGGQWSEPSADDEFVINRATVAQIEENLGTYASVLGITLEMIDPYCGPILAENFENIISRWTKVIIRYPRAAKLFMNKDGGTIMTWIGALQATWPVLLAIYDHHLAKTIQTDKEGRVFKVTTPSNNGANNFSATQPPMPGYDYTVD